MNIGAMDKLCIIEKLSIIYDEYNYETEAWTEFTRLYGDFRPLSSQETISAQAERVNFKARLITHFVDGIDSTMRVRIYGLSDGPELFGIDGVIRDNKTNRQHLTFELREPGIGWE